MSTTGLIKLISCLGRVVDFAGVAAGEAALPRRLTFCNTSKINNSAKTKTQFY
jgi:hypothetical protein